MKDRIQEAKQVDLREMAGLKPSYRGDAYWLCYCPFHSDEVGGRPSLLLYRDHFVCLSTNCGVTGDIFVWYNFKTFGDKLRPRGHRFIEILDMILGEPYMPVIQEAASEEVEDVDLNYLALQYHRVLMNDKERLDYFFRRGFTIETVKQQMWGWDGIHYVIVVWEGRSRSSDVISLRLRAADDNAGMRYSGIKGYNEQVLYNREALLYVAKRRLPAIFVLYGEFDAALAWQDGLPSVSPTNGALAVLPEWFNSYSGFKIIVPDKGEEHAAFDDAAMFGSKGGVIQFPRGMIGKDYSDFRLKNSGSPSYFVRMARRLLAIDVAIRRSQGNHKHA